MMFAKLYRRAIRSLDLARANAARARRATRRQSRLEVLPLEDRITPSVTFVSEAEPNGSTGVADNLPVTSGTVVATGSILTIGDRDYFKFTAPATGRVWAYVDTGGP